MSSRSSSLCHKLSLIQGDCHPVAHHVTSHAAVAEVIRSARKAGFGIGRQVRLGQVLGTIIGYNIGDHGLYYASRFPLLVATDLGAIKCTVAEVRLA